MPELPADTPHILLVNPWICDFAAYDFWAKPLGLLQLAAVLRAHDYRISYIDCLDRFHPMEAPSSPEKRSGRGPYRKTRIPKPGGLSDIPRHYSRYGILPRWFEDDLKNLPRPDLVMVTSLMTYWYPGVVETIRTIRKVHPTADIVLGGVYATLCPEHARAVSGADLVITGSDPAKILQAVGSRTGFSTRPRFDLSDPDALPYPAFDLQRKMGYVPILSSKGCPFSCAYCASGYLFPGFERRSPESLAEEIRFRHEKYGVNNFVFYDDALLVDAENHALPLFEAIRSAGLPISFHTPNAVHIRGITKKTASLMHLAGFQTLRLGLETTAFEDRSDLDAKVTRSEFQEGVELLKAAGFSREQVGAYLLAGLPGQSPDSLFQSVLAVKEAGITPIPAYYSPIPHTRLWDQAKAVSRYDLDADPIFTNNAIFPCSPDPFSWEGLTRLKDLIRA